MSREVVDGVLEIRDEIFDPQTARQLPLANVRFVRCSMNGVQIGSPSNAKKEQ